VIVGSIQAGGTETIIAVEAELKIDIRSVTEQWRHRILGSVKRIVKAECDAGRCPREPVFEWMRTYRLTHNDREVNDVIEKSFSYNLKKTTDQHQKPLASEGVCKLASSANKPYYILFSGGLVAEECDQGEKEGTLNEIPINRSPYSRR
jgi:metal-dependent amidase/aminoacylase/carboxypeptidase family protein